MYSWYLTRTDLQQKAHAREYHYKGIAVISI